VALVAIASFIGRVAFRAAIQDVAASLVGDAVAIKSARDYAQKLEAEQRPRVLGISSETWYAFRMADADYWLRANQLLADELWLKIQQTYLQRTGRTGAPPYVLTMHSSREGVLCNFRRAPRSVGFDRTELRDTVIGTVQDAMKAYVRAAASGQMIGD